MFYLENEKKRYDKMHACSLSWFHHSDAFNSRTIQEIKTTPQICRQLHQFSHKYIPNFCNSHKILSYGGWNERYYLLLMWSRNRPAITISGILNRCNDRFLLVVIPVVVCSFIGLCVLKNAVFRKIMQQSHKKRSVRKSCQSNLFTILVCVCVCVCALVFFEFILVVFLW